MRRTSWRKGSSPTWWSAPCRDAGLLADAVCVHNPRLLTFWRRLVRDLRERRKPAWVLVRRGISLLRHDLDVVARAERAGCAVLASDAAFERITRSAVRRPA